MLVRRLLLPSFLVSTIFTLHCSDDSGGKRGGDDDAGEGGEGSGGKAGSAAGGKAGSGKGGSAGSGGSGTSGSSGSGTAGSSAGTSSGICTPGETRSCVGPGGCEGGQECGPASTWLSCDCGGGSGGSSGEGSGGSGGEGGEGGEDDQAGGASGAGGSDGGSSGSGGSGGSGASSGGGGSGNAGSGGGGAGGASGSTSSGGSAGSSGAGGSTAGSGGAGGSAGSAGSSGAGGSAGSCGAGEGLELVPAEGEDPGSGWIDGSSNCIGVQGAVYAWHDLGGSDITITDTDGRICVTGTAVEILYDDYETYWGSVVSIQLNNPGGGGSASPYDASSYGVDGFEFTLTGSDIPAELRPRFTVANNDGQYCKQVCAPGNQSILVSEAHPECWSDASTSTPSLTQLLNLEFHVPSLRGTEVTFDFCIEDLKAIIDGGPVGDPGECGGGSGSDSCVGLCGGAAPSGCFCDFSCLEFGDCCPDYPQQCL